MLDIKQLIQNTLKVDATLISLMGISATDTRMYPSFNPDAPINGTTYKSYITIQLLTFGEAGGRIRQPIIRLRVFANDTRTAGLVRERLEALLDKKKMTTPAVSGVPAQKLVWIKQIYENDAAPEATSSTNYANVTMDFRFGFEDKGIA